MNLFLCNLATNNIIIVMLYISLGVDALEMFIMAILVTLIFGSFSYMLLSYPEDFLKMSSFSAKFIKKSFLKKYVKFMGWWFLIIVIGIWIIAIISIFQKWL